MDKLTSMKNTASKLHKVADGGWWQDLWDSFKRDYREARARGFTLTEAPRPPKAADPRYASALLENLARGMKGHSVENGGGGRRNFTHDISALKPHIMAKAYDALPGGPGYGGYTVRLEEDPYEGYDKNFRIFASPAPGYKGPEFYVDKNEVVKGYNPQEEFQTYPWLLRQVFGEEK